MTDADYKQLVIENLHFTKNCIMFLTDDIYEPIHHHTWLTLMGLIETWEMI